MNGIIAVVIRTLWEQPWSRADFAWVRPVFLTLALGLLLRFAPPVFVGAGAFVAVLWYGRRDLGESHNFVGGLTLAALLGGLAWVFSARWQGLPL